MSQSGCAKASKVVSFLFVFVLLIGCEHAPSTSLTLLTPAENFVDKDSTFKSDWTYAKKEFLVERQSSFQFAQKVDANAVKKSLERIDAMPRYVSEKPAEMLDEDYAWMRRFLESKPEPKWVSIGGKSDDLSQEVFCLSLDGTKLVTVGKLATIWDCETGKPITKLKSPILEAKHVFFDTKMEHLFVCNAEEIVKVAIKNAETVGRWGSTKSPILNFVKARDVDAFAVLTKDGDVFAMDSELGRKSSMKLEQVLNPNIAMNATGAWVTACTSKGTLRWNVESKGQVPAITEVYQMSLDNALVTSGNRIDRWLHRHKVFVLYDGVAPKTYMRTQYPLLVGSVIRFAHSATVDGSQDWLVTIGVRTAESGKKTVQIQDWNIDTYTSSDPQTLDRESILSASFDRSGERIALKSERGIEIVSRSRWLDCDGMMTRRRILSLFESGDFDRLELCATELRKLGNRHFQWTGAEHFDDVARKLGFRWAELLVKKPDRNLLDRLDSWAEKGSDLAYLSRAACVRYLDYMQRYPADYGLDSIMQRRAVASVAKRGHTFQGDLEKLVSLPDPTPACFAYPLYALNLQTEEAQRNCDKFLQRCVERWPRCSFPHRVMMELFTSSNNPNVSECYPYLKQLPRILPASIARPNGFQPSCMSSRLNEDWFIREEFGISPAQLKAIVEELFSTEALPPWKFEPWLFVGSSRVTFQNTSLVGLGNRDLLLRMVRYHQQHYQLPLACFYNSEEAVKEYSILMDTIDP